MSQVIFINLPVRDVTASARFYAALGFEHGHDFSGETGAAMGWGQVAVMLLDHAYYATFTDKAIIDASTESGVLLCLPFESREAVDDFHDRATRAGGREARPVKDQGGACMAAPSRTSTGTHGRRCGWTRTQRVSRPQRAARPDRPTGPRTERGEYQ